MQRSRARIPMKRILNVQRVSFSGPLRAAVTGIRIRFERGQAFVQHAARNLEEHVVGALLGRADERAKDGCFPLEPFALLRRERHGRHVHYDSDCETRSMTAGGGRKPGAWSRPGFKTPSVVLTPPYHDRDARGLGLPVHTPPADNGE